MIAGAVSGRSGLACKRTCACLLAAWSVLALAAPARADVAAPAAEWQRQVVAVSEGVDTEGRATAITGRLDGLGIPWRAEAFSLDGKNGRNLIGEVGGPADAPLLLIGAHYDRVAVGRGATDNASGVATVLALAEALKARPLANHRVQVAFWDLEEQGLLGSTAWIAAPGRVAPALYVNLDVFGWGDTLWMMTPQADSPLAAAMRLRSGAAKLGFRAGDSYPPTDHLAFLQAQWPAVSFSLLASDEIDGTLAVFAGQKPAAPPKVMQVIHTERDTVGELRSDDIPRALRVLEAGLRDWDSAVP